MDESQFIDALYAWFSAAPRPSAEEVTSHRCLQCDEICDELSRCTARSVPDDFFRGHADSLPLLTPTALRYFLPRYLEFSIRNQDSDLSDLILYSLSGCSSDQGFWLPRFQTFAHAERRAVAEFLKLRQMWADRDPDDPDLVEALHYWSDGA